MAKTINNALIIFEDKKDKNVFFKIAKSFDKNNIKYDLRLASAVKSPELLSELLKQKRFDIIIAGGSSSNILPKVIASKTVSPVISVPCNGTFGGFDSFLSLVQTQKEVPILCAPQKFDNCSFDFLLKDYDSVKITGRVKNEYSCACVETLERFGIDFNEKNSLNLHFFDMKTGFPKKDAINIPLLRKQNPSDALILFDKSKKGFLVGINGGENAAYFAISLINRLSLAEFRENLERMAEKEDKKIRRLSK